ncbi:MAG TPA: BTAD domain-containing putative transcriptional regulator [Casimicrobiaceae bacterium]|nr:BTAD domain-containing putative transcriptional regulator [Casimicrobiaceae bacterium]
MPRSSAPPSVPTLAKFSRPRLYDVVRRERLFERLDAARSHPIVWVAGPPGAGKSTLVASYVEARKLPGIWFQVDAGDSDPGTFFHYLTQAAAALPRSRARALAELPRFGPEYATDLPAFARRYMRALFALFPQRSLLVMDNFHEAPATAAMRHAFGEGLRELPAGVNVVCVSRAPPPPELARLSADQAIAFIGWEQLRFDPDEAAALTAGAGIETSVAGEIHRASDGWAAGIVLMREHLMRSGALDDTSRLPDGKDAVFAYFTGEIFERARPNNRRTLLLSALLPSVTESDAAAITGDADAPRVLDYLYRQHLFTDRRRTGGEPAYQFHALFREFLLAEGRQRLTPDERRDALDRAGGQLVSRGEFDGAAALYREAKAWRALTGLSLHAGAALIAEGRAYTLAEWIDALPAEYRDREPRLALYLGVALLYSDPPRAKALLDAAYAGFEANGDRRRQLMTAAHAVDCHYFEWTDFAPLDRWIGVFERHLGDGSSLTAPYDALRVHSAFLIALLFRQPGHPRIGEVATRVEQLIADESALEVPINFRINAASILLNYHNWQSKGESADALIAKVAPWLSDPRATPQNRVWWRVHVAFNHQLLGRYARARRTMDEAEATAREHGLRSMLFEIYHAGIAPLVGTRDTAGAIAALEKLRSVMSPARRMELAYFRFQESTVRALEGRAQEALRAAVDALAIGRETGLPPMQIPHFLVREGLCRLEAGSPDVALARYEEAIALASGVDRDNFRVQHGLVQAHLARIAGRNDDAAARLREILPSCRERAYTGFLRQAPGVVAPLFALALARGIEPQFVRDLIRERRLSPPTPSIAEWPWPLALRTLGEFVVRRDGVPLASAGKAQKKPLEMLKALVALGGRNVDATMLAAQLWPDADGDDAKTSFDSGLYRLRKLLGVDGALTLTEGRLSLNPGIVWLDVWAFERLLDASPPDVESALECYRGHFLALESAPAWALPLRDRLQARLARAVLAHGQRLEDGREFERARAVYERALELDNLAESIYRRLMVCQRELGDATAALATYRRCRELLSIVLGRKPAPETDAIRDSLVTA